MESSDRQDMERIPTGSKILDRMLHGGYERDIISTVYGPAGSGKTTLCLLCSLCVARSGKKIVYVDTEGGFSVERLEQIAPDSKKVLDKIVFLKPATFQEQKKAFQKLKEQMSNAIGLVVVDTIAMLYRLELGKSEEVYEINRELGRQISYLSVLARKMNIPVLITNQVYSNFDDRDTVNMVGGDIMKYWSKCLIELQITPSGNRRAILKKHRSLPEDQEIAFKIVEGGIIGTKEGGFRFF
ncbi:MAG TPA: DNA repair and recombination protein RadB [Candidatus Nanoarchaeia archaeon]|nr:DNA repair and recombination protein RadB [Candidatus Nanoarchaeia archaeon]